MFKIWNRKPSVKDRINAYSMKDAGLGRFAFIHTIVQRLPKVW